MALNHENLSRGAANWLFGYFPSPESRPQGQPKWLKITNILSARGGWVGLTDGLLVLESSGRVLRYPWSLPSCFVLLLEAKPQRTSFVASSQISQGLLPHQLLSRLDLCETLQCHILISKPFVSTAVSSPASSPLSSFGHDASVFLRSGVQGVGPTNPTTTRRAW